MARSIIQALAVVTLLHLAVGATAASPPEPATIGAIRGYLVSSHAGKLGDLDVLSPEDRGRWNDTDSDAMLVVVELAGPPNRIYDGTAGPKYRIRLIATDMRSSKQLLATTRALSVMGENGKIFYSFLVYMNRCSGLRISAAVIGPGAGKATVREAGFACGE